MTAAVLRHLRDSREHQVLNAVINVLAPISRDRRSGRVVDDPQGPPPAVSPYDLRVVDASCVPLDEDVWDRVVALRRETDPEWDGDCWRQWAQALRDGVDDERVRLLLVMDGPRLLWFAAVATGGEVSLPRPHVRMRPCSTARLPC